MITGDNVHESNHETEMGLVEIRFAYIYEKILVLHWVKI